MSTILQIFGLAVVMAVVFFLGYRRGQTIKERKMIDMYEPSFTEEENEKRRQYAEFCRLYDQMMTDDNFFTGDIAKSSRTDTNIDKLK